MRPPASESAARHHRAVPVLHAVAVGPRQVVGEKRVGAVLVRRQLAVDGALGFHDRLDAGGEVIGVRVAAGVVERDAHVRRRARSVGVERLLEAPPGDGTELGGAVHQELEVRRGEDERIAGRKQLRRDGPVRAGRRAHERDADGTQLEARHPHQAGGHVQVRVRRVDRHVGAVDAVAVDAVRDAQAAVMAGDGPLRRRDRRSRQRAPAGVGGLQVVHVLRELVQRVAARRAAAHVKFGRAVGKTGEGRLHEHPVVLGLGQRDAVLHFLRACGRGDEQRAAPLKTMEMSLLPPSGPADRSVILTMVPRVIIGGWPCSLRPISRRCAACSPT